MFLASVSVVFAMGWIPPLVASALSIGQRGSQFYLSWQALKYHSIFSLLLALSCPVWLADLLWKGSLSPGQFFQSHTLTGQGAFTQGPKPRGWKMAAQGWRRHRSRYSLWQADCCPALPGERQWRRHRSGRPPRSQEFRER